MGVIVVVVPKAYEVSRRVMASVPAPPKTLMGAEMLERFPGNLSSFFRREPNAERDLDIAQRDFVTMAINKAEQRSGCLGDVMASPARTQRYQLRGKEKS